MSRNSMLVGGCENCSSYFLFGCNKRFCCRNDEWIEDEEDDTTNPKFEYQQERSEIMHPTIYIERLPGNITNEGLYNLFAPFGNILSTNALKSKIIPNTQIGFVVYDSLHSVQKAIRIMNGAPPYYLNVKMKLPKKEQIPALMNPKPPQRFHRRSNDGCEYLVPADDGFGRPRLPPCSYTPELPTNVSENFHFNGRCRKFNSDDNAGNEICRVGRDKPEPFFPKQYPEHAVHTGRGICSPEFARNEDILKIYPLNETYTNSSQTGIRGRKTIETDFQTRLEPAILGNPIFSSSGLKNYRDGNRDIQYVNADEEYGDDDDIDDENADDYDYEYDDEGYDYNNVGYDYNNATGVDECEDELDLDEFPTLAITVTQQGRSVDRAMPKLSRVTPISTTTALSERPEFRHQIKEEHSFEEDDEIPRKQPSQMPHRSQNQPVAGRPKGYANKSPNFEKSNTSLSDSNEGNIVRAPRQYPENPEFKNHSFGKAKYEDRRHPSNAVDMQATYYKRAANNQKSVNSYRTNECSPVTSFPRPEVKSEPPPIGASFNCSISHFELPDLIWIQFQSKKLKSLIDNLNDQQKHADNKFKPRIGGVYLIDHELKWFRGRIIEVNRNGKYNVLLIDYGKTLEDIPVVNISLLSNTNLSYPELATACIVSPAVLEMYTKVENIFDAARNTEVVVVLEVIDDNDFEVVRLDIRNRESGAVKKPIVATQKSKLPNFQLKSHVQDDKKPVKAATIVPKPGPRASTEDLPVLKCRLQGLTNAILVYINNAENICVCLEQCREDLERLLTVIGHHPLLNKSYIPQIGELVLAKSSDEFCYRAEVLEIFVVDKTARVVFIDYGNEEVVALDHIGPIPPEALEFPQMGLIVSLSTKPTSLQPLNAMLNKGLQMKVVDSTEEPILVEFYSDGKSIFGSDSNNRGSRTQQKPEPNKKSTNTFFTLKDLQVTHIDLGPVEATFGWATNDYVYIIPEIDNEVLSILDKFKENDIQVPYQPRVNELCLVLLEGDWHRAVCIGQEDTGKFILFFIDCGYTDEVDSDRIRPCFAELTGYPAMAVKCRVSGYPERENIKRNIESLETLESDIGCDVISIKKDYVEVMLM